VLGTVGLCAVCCGPNRVTLQIVLSYRAPGACAGAFRGDEAAAELVPERFIDKTPAGSWPPSSSCRDCSSRSGSLFSVNGQHAA